MQTVHGFITIRPIRDQSIENLPLGASAALITCLFDLRVIQPSREAEPD
jgi:hypothetical protein